MYGKIFESIYDGTLAEDWRALVTFQQMIILSDSEGIVDMTPTAISRRTGIPIEHIKAGIEILEAADPYSRTPDQDGKRILRIDPERPWGWQLVNHEKYRSMRSAEDRKEYMRNYMRERRENEKTQENQESCKQESLHVNTDKQELARLANESVSSSVSVLNKKNESKKSKRFEKPSLPEIREYCQEINSSINPTTFFNHYETIGWKVGKNPMKDWKAAVRGWTSRENS